MTSVRGMFWNRTAQIQPMTRPPAKTGMVGFSLLKELTQTKGDEHQDTDITGGLQAF